MNRPIDRGLILASLLILLSACSSVMGPSKPDTVMKPPVQCPQSIAEEQWALLSEECRGPLGLQLARRAAEKAEWRSAIEWVSLSRPWLDSDLLPEALFSEAEARYALGETGTVEADFQKALKGGISRSHASLAYYYLAESAFARGAAQSVLFNLASALDIDSQADWRFSADAMLGALARSSVPLSFDGIRIPPEITGWREFVVAEKAYRDGKWGDARRAFLALASDDSLARFDLRSMVEARNVELRERTDPITNRFGIILPLTSRAGAAGQFALRGLLLGLDPYIIPNLELYLADNRGEPQRTEHALREFNRQGVMGAIGPLLGKSSTAAVAMANRLGFPLVVLSGADLPPLAPWTVRVALTPDEQVSALLDEAMGKRGYRQFAILYPDDPYGRTMMNDFWDEVVERGGLITGVQSYAPASTDFKTAIRSLVGADAFTPEELQERKTKNQPIAHLDFDALFIPDAARTAGLVIPQLLYYDVRGPLFMGTSAWNNPQLVQLARDYADGSIFVDWYVAGTENEAVREFLARYTASYKGQQPISLSAQAYEAGRLLQLAANASNRDEARRRLYDARWHGLSGTAQVRDDGEIERPLYLLTVKKRRIEIIDQEPHRQD